MGPDIPRPAGRCLGAGHPEAGRSALMLVFAFDAFRAHESWRRHVGAWAGNGTVIPSAALRELTAAGAMLDRPSATSPFGLVAAVADLSERADGECPGGRGRGALGAKMGGS